MPTDDERRLHPRVDAPLTVRTRLITPQELPLLASALGQADPPIPDLNLVRAGSKITQVTSINLSLGGLSASGDLEISGDRAYTRGADVVVELELPDGEPPMRAVAQVMWNRDEGGKHQMGLMFLLVAEAAYQRMQAYLAKKAADEA